jgi:hypothetical protein
VEYDGSYEGLGDNLAVAGRQDDTFDWGPGVKVSSSDASDNGSFADPPFPEFDGWPALGLAVSRPASTCRELSQEPVNGHGSIEAGTLGCTATASAQRLAA